MGQYPNSSAMIISFGKVGPCTVLTAILGCRSGNIWPANDVIVHANKPVFDEYFTRDLYVGFNPNDGLQIQW